MNVMNWVRASVVALVIAPVVVAGPLATTVKCANGDCDIPRNAEGSLCGEWFYYEDPYTHEPRELCLWWVPAEPLAISACQQISCDNACADYGQGGGHPYYSGPTPVGCLGATVAEGESACEIILTEESSDGGVPIVSWALAEKTCFCTWPDGENEPVSVGPRTPIETILDPIQSAINRLLGKKAKQPQPKRLFGKG